MSSSISVVLYDFSERKKRKVKRRESAFDGEQGILLAAAPATDVEQAAAICVAAEAFVIHHQLEGRHREVLFVGAFQVGLNEGAVFHEDAGGDDLPADVATIMTARDRRGRAGVARSNPR